MFKRGDVVWARLRTFPWWPAVVINPEDCGRDDVGRNKSWVFWLGDHKIAQVEYRKILDFESHYEEKCTAKMSRSLTFAVEEALTILATRYGIQCSDPSLLAEWAKEGFAGRSDLHSSNYYVLPAFVMDVLGQVEFQRQHESISDEEMDVEIVQVLEDVSRGRRSLEDICVMCCKAENSVIMQHPLFVGGVCRDCKKSVVKILKLQKKQMHDICVICGQGGTLVYCCDRECLSSYCKTCIDYMTPKESFTKIMKDNNWNCYLCQPNYNIRCHIQRREFHSSVVTRPPPVPKEKLPLRVIGLTDTALPVLKQKKIAVSLYCIESTNCLNASDEDDYHDFTEEELLEIRPNFIFGSIFVSRTVDDDRTKILAAFSTAFYKFLYRLNNAKTTSPTVYFLFMTDDGILNALMKSRVFRFLLVHPVIIEYPDKKICVWSYIPDLKGIRQRRLALKKGASIEDDILNKLLDPLKNCFKKEI